MSDLSASNDDRSDDEVSVDHRYRNSNGYGQSTRHRRQSHDKENRSYNKMAKRKRSQAQINAQKKAVLANKAKRRKESMPASDDEDQQRDRREGKLKDDRDYASAEEEEPTTRSSRRRSSSRRNSAPGGQDPDPGDDDNGSGDDDDDSGRDADQEDGPPPLAPHQIDQPPVQPDQAGQQAAQDQQAADQELLKKWTARAEAKVEEDKSRLLKKKTMGPEENHWWQVILAAVKKCGHHKIQFMNTEKRLEGFAHMICRDMNLKEFEGKEGESLLKKRVLWVARNKCLICSALNECRNYSASQVRAESVLKPPVHEKCTHANPRADPGLHHP